MESRDSKYVDGEKWRGFLAHKNLKIEMVEIKFDLPYDKNSGWNFSLSGHGQNSSVSVKQNDWWCIK